MKRAIVIALASAAALALALPASSASDTYRSRQWALDRIHAEQAWSGSKGAGVTIAIVDSGIDLTHPDLKSKIISSYDCIGGSCSPGGDDDAGHGSHVAGIAAAATGNGTGISGVAPAAKLMAVKVLAANGEGNCSDVVTGIHWAADHGARVINLSLGPEIFSSPLSVLCIDGLEQAASYAWDKGDVVVISAGNDNLFSLYSSADLIVVGATRSDDERASYSNSGADIYAPGGYPGSGGCTSSTCIFSTWKDGTYRAVYGTSMAAPHVSGIAALLLAKGYSNAQVLSRLQSTADEVNGIRRVNAARAVGAASSSAPSTKKPAPSTQTRPAASGGNQAGAPTSPAATTSAKSTAAASNPSASGSPIPGSGSPRALGSASIRNGSSFKPVALVFGALGSAVLAIAVIWFVRRRSRRPA